MAEYELEMPFEHYKQVLEYLNGFREACDETLCDVRLTVGGNSVYAHRCVLAACSAYFQGMFSGAFVESSCAQNSSGIMEVDLSDAVSNVSHLETLVSSLYTGCLTLSQENITSITQLACFLLVDCVQSLCQRYLQDTFSIHTCVAYFKLADRFGLAEIKKEASKMLCSRFHDHFLYSQEMLTVSSTCLHFDFFQYVTSPSVLLQFLSRWVEWAEDRERSSMLCDNSDSREEREAAAKKLTQMKLYSLSHDCDIINEFRQILPEHLPGSSVVTDRLIQTLHKELAFITGQESSHCSVPHQGTVTIGTSRPTHSAHKESMHHEQCFKSPTEVIYDTTHSCESVTTQREETAMHDVLVAFVPGKETVDHVTAVECAANRGRQPPVELTVCVYSVRTKQWFYIGRTMFPDSLEERFSWRAACLHPKVYFVSLKRQAMHVLDLESLQWSQVDCNPVCQNLSCEIRSLVPIAVSGSLYVLASDKMKKRNDGTLYETQQRYLRLQPDGSWEPVADVHHCHMATPLSILSVSGSKVYVVKANITIPSQNNQKSLLLIREGHVFDSQTGQISKFEGKTFAPSPMRVLVLEDQLVIVDGEGWCRQLNSDRQDWTSRKLDLSDIRWCRAASDEAHFPCLTNVSAAMGASVWEFSGYHDHNSALLELRLTNERGVINDYHPPPPFRYLTALTAGQLSEKLLSSLRPCHYIHA